MDEKKVDTLYPRGGAINTAAPMFARMTLL